MLTRTAVCVVLIAAVALAAADEPATSAGRIKQLREERVAVLKEVYDAATALLETGSPIGLEEVYQAKIQWLRAQLELATTTPQRIKIHEEIVTAAEEWFRAVAARGNIGAEGGSHIEVLKTKARLLEARIALEQAKAAN